ncbi:MAG: HEAT repeat domain-containing protein, partial [Cyanobacteriota bacterium]
SDNIFNGNINIDNQTKAIVIIDEFYNKTGTPFIGKQIGTDKIAKNIKLSEKIAKSLSASIIQHYNGKDYVEMVIPLLKDPDSDVRGITATCISNVNSKQYLPALEEIYKTDSQDYVKAYAIKGLGLYEFEKYKEEIINLYENGDLLSKTIAAGLLLKNGDNRGLDLLRKAIKNESEILNLRALEFLVRSKTMIEEEKIIAFLREARLLKNIYAAKLLGVMQKEEYHHLLLKEYKSNENKNKLALAIGLLEYDDLTGLDYIKKVMISPDYSETLFATEALIEYCNKKNMCIEE